MKDDLARIKGVGDVTFLGPRDYSMRVWLDPDKLAARDLTANDVINAVREQNRQVAAGRLGQPPVPTAESVQFQLPINTAGRLTTEEQFEDIVLKTSADGGVVHFKDVVRETRRDADGRIVDKGIELGAKNYDVNSYLDGEPSCHAGRVPIARLQRARHGRGHPRQDGGTQGAFPRRASNIGFTTTQPCSSKNRSPASSTR